MTNCYMGIRSYNITEYNAPKHFGIKDYAKLKSADVRGHDGMIGEFVCFLWQKEDAAQSKKATRNSV